MQSFVNSSDQDSVGSVPQPRNCWSCIVTSLLACLACFGTLRPHAAAQCPQWLPQIGQPGVSGTVRALAVLPDGDLVAGGQFLEAGNVPASHIARYDADTGVWSPLGSGVTTGDSVNIYAIAVLPDGDIVAGGYFSGVGGIVTKNIARFNFNTNTWTPLSSGLEGTVYALAVLPNGDLVAAGYLYTPGIRNIAVFNFASNTWSSLSTGTNGRLYALAITPSGGILVGGSFTTAGAVATRNIALYNPLSNTWAALGSGVSSDVNAVAVLPDTSILAGGVFTTAGGLPARRIARYDFTTSSWSTYGSGLNGRASALKVLHDGTVLVGGSFNTAGDISARNVALLNPITNTWSAMGSGIANYYVYALEQSLAGDLTVGGYFYQAGGAPAHHIAGFSQSGGAPSLYLQPRGRIECTGASTFSFSVAVSDAGPVAYSWRRNSQALSDQSGHISGALTSTLTIENVSSSVDAGSYDCLVTNNCGTTISNPAVLSFPTTCPSVIYVNASMPAGSGDGGSWSTAFSDLQDALDTALRNNNQPQIWVAQGIYRPDRETQDPNASFILPAGVTLLGGFAGDESDASESNPSLHQTTLSGTLAAGRSYHVVTAQSFSSPAQLDGFTISGGAASAVNTGGGGVFVNSAALRISNCIITNNFSYPDIGLGGAGMYIRDSRVQMTNCQIVGNACGTGPSPGGGYGGFGGSGGGIFSDYSTLTLTDCLFAENAAGDGGDGSCTAGIGWPGGDGGNGGAIQTISSTMTATNCVFVGNEAGRGGFGAYCNVQSSGPGAPGSGGGISNYSSTLTLTNCTFASNTTAIIGQLSTTTLHNCIIANDPLAPGALATYSLFNHFYPGEGNLIGDPRFVNPAGNDLIVGTRDDDLTLASTSPCIDAGNNALLPTSILTDLSGGPRFIDDQFTLDTGVNGGSGGSAIIDMGAFERPSICPADFNGDGSITGDDISAFFHDWELGMVTSDVNIDGGIDGSDIATFFTHWEAGC